MSSKVFETTAMQFHHQVATRVRNTLTELEFYMFISKDLKMFTGSALWNSRKSPTCTLVVFLKLPPPCASPSTLVVPMTHSLQEKSGYSGRPAAFLRFSQQPQPVSHSPLLLPTLPQLAFSSITDLGAARNLATHLLCSFLHPRPARYGRNHSFSVSFLPNTMLPLILITVNALNVLFICVPGSDNTVHT